MRHRGCCRRDGFLQALGASPLKWISSSDTAMMSVIIVTVWKSLGYAMI